MNKRPEKEITPTILKMIKESITYQTTMSNSQMTIVPTLNRVVVKRNDDSQEEVL